MMKHFYWHISSFFLFSLVSGSLQNSLLEICDRPAQFKANSILQPQKVTDVGVELLKKIVVNSMRSCYFYCCQLDSCTTAVFKSKVPHDCFLFNCGSNNSCIYTEHEGYDIVTLTTKEVHIPASLDEPCDQTRICSTNHTVCSHGRCACQTGWIKQGVECVRSVCHTPALQFQCADAVTCVAIYDHCNGVIECPDGSDEVNCVVASADVNFKINPASTGNHSLPTSDMTHLHIVSPTTHMQQPEYSTVSDLDELADFRKHHPTDADYGEQSSLPMQQHYGRPRSAVLHTTSPAFSQADDDPIRVSEFRRRVPKFPVHSRSLEWPEQQIQSLDYVPTSYHPLNFEKYPYGDDVVQPPSLRPSMMMPVEDERVLPWSSRSSKLHRDFNEPKVQRERSYFRDYSNDRDYQPHRYQRTDTVPEEELIDPSVLSSLSPSEWSRSGTGPRKSWLRSSRRRTQASELDDMPVSSNRHKLRFNHDSLAGSPQYTTSPPIASHSAVNNNPGSTPSPKMQSEGHTAAFILAFSLGLVCCFIGILVVECYRRHRLHRWTTTGRETDIPVLFRGNGKFTSTRTRAPRRPRRFPGNVGNSIETEEENKALCEGLVL